MQRVRKPTRCMPPAAVRLVRTAGLPLLRQLKLEEALLRADGGNWCLINDGAASATAVLGLSGCACGARPAAVPPADVPCLGNRTSC